MAGDLNRPMRRSAEAVESEPTSALGSREAPAAKSADSRTQKRRSLLVRKCLRNRIDKILRSNQVLRVPSVHGVARKKRMVAEIFFSGAAVFAGAVCFVQPRDANPRADRETSGSLAELLH